jgi:hypothetical protein
MGPMEIEPLGDDSVPSVFGPYLNGAIALLGNQYIIGNK